MPMRGTTIVAALFAAGAIMATGALAQETKTDTPAVQEAPQWPAFRSPERGFEIAFPTTPKATSSSVAGQNPLIRYNFEAYEGDDTVYRLVVLEYPAGKAPNPAGDSLYVKMVSAYAKESESKVRKRGPQDHRRPRRLRGHHRRRQGQGQSSREHRSCRRPHLHAGLRRPARPRHKRGRRALPLILPRYRRRTGDHGKHLNPLALTPAIRIWRGGASHP